MVHERVETVKQFGCRSLTYFNYVICAIQRLKSYRVKLGKLIQVRLYARAHTQTHTHTLELVQGWK